MQGRLTLRERMVVLVAAALVPVAALLFWVALREGQAAPFACVDSQQLRAQGARNRPLQLRHDTYLHLRLFRFGMQHKQRLLQRQAAFRWACVGRHLQPDHQQHSPRVLYVSTGLLRAITRTSPAPTRLPSTLSTFL